MDGSNKVKLGYIQCKKRWNTTPFKFLVRHFHEGHKNKRVFLIKYHASKKIRLKEAKRRHVSADSYLDFP